MHFCMADTASTSLEESEGIFQLAIPAFCKPEEGWYGLPKYCYKKAIHVVMNLLCSSLWTCRLWFVTFYIMPIFDDYSLKARPIFLNNPRD